MHDSNANNRLAATIAAPATVSRPAARAIIRTSGPDAFDIFTSLAGAVPQLRRLIPIRLAIEVGSSPARYLAFTGPRSHTGEDVVEYHLSGNPLLVHLVLQELLSRGCQPAQPGEFSARAFFNGKTTLDAAEAVAASISASNDAQLAAALQVRQGGFGRRIASLTDRLAELLSLAELAIDFVEEDVAVLDPREAAERIEQLRQEIEAIRSDSTRLDQIGQPVRIAVVGPANAGKSSLINRLVGSDRSVTSPAQGTTRDVLEAHLDFPGGTIILLDTAGLLVDPAGPIDAEAVRRTRSAVETADHLLFITAADEPTPRDELVRRADLLVVTKADLASTVRRAGAVSTSSLTGEGIESLRRHLEHLAFSREQEKAPLQARHAALLERAAHALAAESLETGMFELLAADLRDALDALGAISGVVTPDDVLGRIFSGFCIGK